MSSQKRTSLSLVGKNTPQTVEVKRQNAVVQAVKAAPLLVAALVEQAEVGDVKAAALVLEIAGLFNRGGRATVNIANQIRLTDWERDHLKASLEEYDC